MERTDVGRVRDHNEDYLGYAVARHSRAGAHARLAVCAGRRSGRAGKGRSRVANRGRKHGRRISTTPRMGNRTPPLLPRLVQQANAHVFEAAVAGGRTSAGMATTIVACALRYDRVAVAHVGDSRCYLIRNGKAAQITRDHTVASEQVRLGLVTAQEAARSRQPATSSAARWEPSWLSTWTPTIIRFLPATFCCSVRTACTVRWKPRKWPRFAARGMDLHRGGGKTGGACQ